ncbi:hypothetical protein FSP39_021583 [Pinctada imbricata]|uniref:Endonuclease/exonuclease/phosphatase domain-containing protein n=1 Tax=Pinctada imbricata TaxID=66713 RepID=A0AA89BZX1_PINIB|nr:hypothetical protein FSP39_021583 [Pinctada imbricata]
MINDFSLEQIVNRPTRGERILDLILTNKPTSFNDPKILPPLGKSDHDIAFVECNISLKRVRKQTRTIFKYRQSNWDKIRIDIKEMTDNMLENYKTKDIDQTWNYFKNTLLKSINENTPTKTITSKMKLPWITNQLRLQINRNKRLHHKCKTNRSLTAKYKSNKKALQSDMRKAYWTYIENMIFDLPVNEPDSPIIKKTPKKLYSYIKSAKNDNTGIPSLRDSGILTDSTQSKANILNRQFEKAFTTETSDIPIPNKGPSPHQTMPNINITDKSITKLLQNINPNKVSYDKFEILKIFEFA